MRWRRRLARLGRWLLGLAAIGVIVLAVSLALLQLLLPLLARHPQWVQAQLSERLQRQVSFSGLDSRWRMSGPSFVLHQLTIQPAADAGGEVLRIPQAQLWLDLGAWASSSRHLLNLSASGLRLDLLRDADGTWHVNGFAAMGGDQAMPSRLSIGLTLDNLSLAIVDGGNQHLYLLLAPRLQVSLQGDRMRVGGILQRPGAAGTLRGAGTFRIDGSQGRLWLAGSQMDLPGLLAGVDLGGGYAVRRGQGDFASWLDWRRGKVVRELARFDLRELQIASPAGGVAQVPALKGIVELNTFAPGYRLRWAGDDGSALVANLHSPDTAQMRVEVAARKLALAPLAPWLALDPQLPPGVSRWLGQGRPRGVVNAAQLNWSRAVGLTSVDMTFNGLGIDPVEGMPGIDRLSGELRGDASALALSLPPQTTVVRVPKVFRKPFVMANLAGELAAWSTDEAWHIGLDALDFEGEGFAGGVRGEVQLPHAGGSPFLNIYAHVDHAQVTAAKLFWPITSMSPAAIAWLDRALVDGNVVQGDALVRGSLADWPFRKHEGRFEAQAQISDTTLDYGVGWPRAEGIDAVARFTDNGMQVEASAGQALGNHLSRAVASIPDFADTTLDINVQGNSSAASAMEFVRASPIGRSQTDALSKLSLGGKLDFDFHLLLPVKSIDRLSLEGNGHLHDATLNVPDYGVLLDKLDGPLHFDAKGMSAGPLVGGFRGVPASLALAVAGATSEPNTVLSAQLSGRYAVSQLTEGYPQLAWLNSLADGRADFTIGFDIAHPDGATAVTQTLSIASSLSGMALKLPAPLDKPAATRLPLQVNVPLPLGRADMQLALGDSLRGRFRLPGVANRPLAATILLGSQMPESVPAQGLRVLGRTPRLDATGWVQYAGGGSGGDAGPGLESLDVTAGQTLVFGHAFSDMQIQAAPQAQSMNFVVGSADMAGTIRVPSVDLRQRGITAQLQRLHWPTDPPPRASASEPPVAAKAASLPLAAASGGSVPARAVSVAATVAAAGEVASPSIAMSGIAPAVLPPLHLSISDLRLGDAKLGEARLETWPTAQGMHIDQLRALSKSVQVNASGDWNGSAEDNQTHLKISFTAQDLGDMLGAFGYDNVFSGGKTQAELDASWPGAPSALSLATLDGRLSVNVTDGRIPEAPLPGVGRLFGLASLAELPRRLTFDFGDVFGKGLAFDAITGDFNFFDGNANTDNLKIRSPAAAITITGRTGLRSKDYDLEMLAIPHVGNSLPVVGAVVGGPIGAAAGLAMQGLLGHGINRVASLRYRITGPWDKPKMTLLERRSVPVPAPVKPPLLPAPATSAAAVSQ
ncbi:MAG: YhdP family protein [Dyella sp.]